MINGVFRKSSIWKVCTRKVIENYKGTGGGVPKLDFQEGWGERLKNQQQKIFSGVRRTDVFWNNQTQDELSTKGVFFFQSKIA